MAELACDNLQLVPGKPEKKARGRPRRPVHTIIAKIAGDGLNRYEGGARATRTWRQYASAIGIFERWCEERGLTPMPASAATVKAWAVEMADLGRSAATVRLYLAALSTWHKVRDQPFEYRPLSGTIRGIARASGSQRKALPLLREQLCDILAMLDPSRPGDCRDGAMLTIGWAAAMRRSEIVGLDWLCLGAGSTATGILHRKADGLLIELLTSKTSQGETVWLDIPRADMPSAYVWAQHWAQIANLQPGEPVFRGMLSHGVNIGGKRLSDASAAVIIRKRYAKLELARGATEAEAFARSLNITGHSLRVGYITSAALAGTPEYLIRERSRHKSAGIVAGYVRAAETRQNHGLGRVGI